MFTLPLGLVGCCSIYGAVAAFTPPDTRGPQIVSDLVALVGDTVRAYGFKEERPVKLANRELTTYYLRSGLNRIDVDVDHETLSIALTDFSRRESPLAVQVQRAIERHVKDVYHTEVHFNPVPCPWLGP